MTPPRTYREVQAEILARITQGPWGPGTLIPNEVDLAAEFGCSRTTVNRALREVSALGLLDRKRKAGTRVRQVPVRQARFDIPLARADIEATGAVYGYRLLRQDHDPAPHAAIVRMGLAAAAPVLHVVCLHCADGVPYQIEDRWINLAALPQAADQDFAAISPNEWLIAMVPFSQVEIRFLAVAAGPDEVAHLDHAPGGPVFRIERTTWWQGAALTHVRLAHRAGHTMTTRY